MTLNREQVDRKIAEDRELIAALRRARQRTFFRRILTRFRRSTTTPPHPPGEMAVTNGDTNEQEAP